jgi:hypothetical protein
MKALADVTTGLVTACKVVRDPKTVKIIKRRDGYFFNVLKIDGKVTYVDVCSLNKLKTLFLSFHLL